MRLFWFAAGMAWGFLFGSIASDAFASPNPKAEMPLTATESLKESVPSKPRCMRPRIFVLAQRLPNGKAIPVMTAVVMVPCE